MILLTIDWSHRMQPWFLNWVIGKQIKRSTPRFPTQHSILLPSTLWCPTRLVIFHLYVTEMTLSILLVEHSFKKRKSHWVYEMRANRVWLILCRYLIADYEQSTFSISQCNWDGNLVQNIVAIPPLPRQNVPPVSQLPPVLVIVLLGFFFLYRISHDRKIVKLEDP